MLPRSSFVSVKWTVAQSIQLVNELRNHEVDLIDVSSGGNLAKAVIPVGPGYQTQVRLGLLRLLSKRTTSFVLSRPILSSLLESSCVIRSGLLVQPVN